jgi:hypothetical protein
MKNKLKIIVATLPQRWQVLDMKTNNTINGVKLMKKGVKDLNGNYTAVRYSVGERLEKGNHSKSFEAAWIRSKDYKNLPSALFPQNDTNTIEDYFEKDTAIFRKGTPEFDAIKAVLA